MKKPNKNQDRELLLTPQKNSTNTCSLQLSVAIPTHAINLPSSLNVILWLKLFTCKYYSCLPSKSNTLFLSLCLRQKVCPKRWEMKIMHIKDFAASKYTIRCSLIHYENTAYILVIITTK